MGKLHLNWKLNKKENVRKQSRLTRWGKRTTRGKRPSEALRGKRAKKKESFRIELCSFRALFNYILPIFNFGYSFSSPPHFILRFFVFPLLVIKIIVCLQTVRMVFFLGFENSIQNLICDIKCESKTTRAYVYCIKNWSNVDRKVNSMEMNKFSGFSMKGD